MRNPLTIADSALLILCGFHLGLRIPIAFVIVRHRNFTIHTNIIFCLWNPQTVPDSANFVANAAKLIADPAKSHAFGAILS